MAKFTERAPKLRSNIETVIKITTTGGGYEPLMSRQAEYVATAHGIIDLAELLIGNQEFSDERFDQFMKLLSALDGVFQGTVLDAAGQETVERVAANTMRTVLRMTHQLRAEEEALKAAAPKGPQDLN